MENRKIDNNHAHRPMISICGKRHEINLGRVVIDLMGCPRYVTIRISKNKDGIIIFPCKSTERLAFRVPDNIFTDRGAQVHIKGKQFVLELLNANGLDEVINYAVPGDYIEDRKTAVFKMRDAYKNTAKNSVM